MTVGLLQERGLLHRLLAAAFTSEQEHQRVERDAQIEPERGVMHIPIVECAFFLCGDKIAAVDLRPAGNAGAHNKTQAGGHPAYSAPGLALGPVRAPALVRSRAGADRKLCR